MTILKNTSRIMAASALLCLSVGVVSAQSYYDDDLYYDASKASKKPKTEKKVQPTTGYGYDPYSSAQEGNNRPGTLYYYDGADYVPWDNVGQYNAADSYVPTGSSTRDVDEYNRHTPGVAYRETPDSISLQQFEDMSATRNLARFDNSGVAQQAISDYENGDYSNTGDYSAAYSEGYNSGYNAAANNNSNTNLSISFGVGYPYGYYNSWGWPYYSWNNYYWNYPYWNWGWDPYWNWSWGWTSPSWGWGWGYPPYCPGYWGGGWTYYRPSAPAGHRPRGGTNYGYSNNRGSYGRNSHYGASTGSSSVRPGYRPPATAGANGGYYGGSSSGRGSHFGTTRNPGYTPSGNSSSGHRYSGSSSGSYRPTGTSSNSNRGSFGAGQSQRNGSYNNSNRSSGSYNQGSSRSSGSFGGGRSGGGYSGGGGRSGGGGHRSR